MAAIKWFWLRYEPCVVVKCWGSPSMGAIATGMARLLVSVDKLPESKRHSPKRSAVWALRKPIWQVPSGIRTLVDVLLLNILDNVQVLIIAAKIIITVGLWQLMESRTAWAMRGICDFVRAQGLMLVSILHLCRRPGTQLEREFGLYTVTE